MARLAALIAEKDLFTPLPERFMTDPKDRDKPGLFLALFPNSLSRLFLTLLWKINGEKEGDAVVLSNAWLREFAQLTSKSLRKCRDCLHENCVIRYKSIGGGRQYLYRLVNRRGKPLADELDDEALTRLKDTETQGRAVRKGLIKGYMRRKSVPLAQPEPLSAASSS
jgi:hypothetical protein